MLYESYKIMPSTIVNQLRKQISTIEQGSLVKKGDDFLSTGSKEFDQVFPANVIASGSLLEMQPESYRQRAAAMGATLALSARLLHEKTGPLIWCQLRDPERLHLHAPGLMAFGVDPERVIKLTLKNEQDLLWAMEEALDCSYISGVVGVLWKEKLYDFTASRRLNLRAKESGVSALMLRSHRANGSTAADMRWMIKAKESSQMPPRKAYLPRIGKTIWQIDLKKCRGANQGSWQVGWDRETVSFDLASRLAGGTSLPESPARVSHRYTG